MKNPFDDFPKENMWWLGEKALEWKKLYEDYVLRCIELLETAPLNHLYAVEQPVAIEWLDAVKQFRDENVGA